MFLDKSTLNLQIYYLEQHCSIIKLLWW